MSVLTASQAPLPTALLIGLAATTAMSIGVGDEQAHANADTTLVGSWTGEARINRLNRKGIELQVHANGDGRVQVILLDENLRFDASFSEKDGEAVATGKLGDLGKVTMIAKVDAAQIEGHFESGGNRIGRFAAHRMVTLEDRDYADVVGWYSRDGQPLQLMRRPLGGLQMVNMEGKSIAMGSRMPEARDRFFRLDDEARVDQHIRFERNDDGLVEAAVWIDKDGTESRTPRVKGPYRWKQLSFANADTELEGVLLLPHGEGPHPAAVYVHGSGPNTRHFFWNAYVARHLVRNGIAVLLYDKRGCGDSSGDWRTSSFLDLAKDAQAGVAKLREQVEIDAEQIGVIGLSQGGWIVPIVASNDPRVAFAVNLSGSTLPIVETVNFEMQELGRARFLPKPHMELIDRLQQTLGAYFRKQGSWEDYERVLEEASDARSALRMIAKGYPSSPNSWKVGFYRAVGEFDPEPFWSKMRQPILVIHGLEDKQMPAQQSADRVREILKASGHTDHTIETYESRGHSLIDPKRGWIDVAILERISSWIKEKAR